MDSADLHGGSPPLIFRKRANPSLAHSNLDRLEYAMTIYKQPGSPYYYYDFYFEGRRYQKSTHLRNKTIAHRVREGKSDRAVRDVPITSCALPIFKRRLS